MTCVSGESCGESHAAGKCPWARVESEDELRAGMAVQFRPCRWCGRRVTEILMSSRPANATAWNPRERAYEPGESRIAWQRTHVCADMQWVQHGGAIRDGRLFRLSDLPPDASESDETTRPVTRPKVRQLATSKGERR